MSERVQFIADNSVPETVSDRKGEGLGRDLYGGHAHWTLALAVRTLHNVLLNVILEFLFAYITGGDTEIQRCVGGGEGSKDIVRLVPFAVQFGLCSWVLSVWSFVRVQLTTAVHLTTLTTGSLVHIYRLT